ncbi:hypothetical protein MYCTH_2300177 [Thermothelomyces thermophilus ATCC 42464]|uniref:Uncharacterized protein n=1 Tax=Thermothelomyces thermophilus (strain ATCC 42464 / BCRC 31852 / DSM 1799) TaxID=573729 RepID=G2QAJ1_THET4|nr:uncharacterized protein MYCTH_2300177 [Thermothelomyces thermophilus ATCC 42464]AEO55887.1 hypothetical protein MYCTH_2300177 [Thermothelomyces thermophilus ATCC 42464]
MDRTCGLGYARFDFPPGCKQILRTKDLPKYFGRHFQLEDVIHKDRATVSQP